MQWEYTVRKHRGEHGLGGEFNEDLFGQELNELGEAGWELVNVMDTNLARGATRYLVAVFKRPKQAPAH